MIVFGAGLMLAASAVVLIAAESSAIASPTTAPSTQPTVTPINKLCPVQHDPIDPHGRTVVYKGQVIGFCCDDCEEFNKDPEKYMKDLK
jgi:hypothetical protein